MNPIKTLIGNRVQLERNSESTRIYAIEYHRRQMHEKYSDDLMRIARRQMHGWIAR